MNHAQMERLGGWSTVGVVFMLVALIGLVGRVVQLKVYPDARLADAAGTSMSRRYALHRRGNITDRRGRLIASTTMGHRLFVDPQTVNDAGTIAVDIADVIGVDAIAVDRVLQSRLHTQYAVVVDQLEGWQIDAIRTARLRGIGMEERPIRHYPWGNVARRLIGKVGVDHHGLAGMEHILDPRLRAERGRMTYLRDAGRRLMWVERDAFEPGHRGEHVQLSIDLVIQELAEKRLAEAIDKHNAGGGRLIVLDCTTGEIVAMTDALRSRPDWDEQTSDPIRALDAALGRNRCITDPYEPGSTFKPFVWSVATELGLAKPTDVLETPGCCGHRTSRGRLIHDEPYLENATWERVLVKSVNSGMAIVAERMTDAQMQGVIDRFGFGRRSGCDLPGESAGIVTPPSRWNHYTQTSVSMGHEIAVTPVQMVRAFSVFALDGLLPRPRMTAVTRNEEPYQVFRRVLPEPIARTVRRAMRSVVLSGTGTKARSTQYRLFGKSGTAQLPIREGGGYHDDRYVSSFIAGAPLDNPRLVVLCVIDDPDKTKGLHYGGKVAGPVVRDVMDGALAYLGIAPDENPW